MRIDLSCKSCGSNRIAFNHATSDACHVACEDCGIALGTFGDLKASVSRQMERRD